MSAASSAAFVAAPKLPAQSTKTPSAVATKIPPKAKAAVVARVSLEGDIEATSATTTNSTSDGGVPTKPAPTAQKNKPKPAVKFVAAPKSKVAPATNKQDSERPPSPADTHYTNATDTNMEEMKQELEELQIRTIWGLVESLDIDVGGVPGHKKFLYITNGQARRFNFTNINNFLDALDISPRPQLVINLFPSHWFSPLVTAGCMESRGVYEEALCMGLHGETSIQEHKNSEMAIFLFLQECILPVAIQTNALVMVHSDECALANAWSDLCESQKEKNGGSMPFSTVCVTQPLSLEVASLTPGTVSEALRAKSKRWSSHGGRIQKCMNSHFGPQRVSWRCPDVPMGCSHVILIESISEVKKDGVSEWKRDIAPKDMFKNALLQRLGLELPNVAVATYSKGSVWYIYVYVCVCACIFMCACVHVYILIHTHMHVGMCIDIYV
jgi:hypothetical protein